MTRVGQLLHVTATSLATEYHEQLTGLLAGEAALLEAFVSTQVKRHLGKLHE